MYKHKWYSVFEIDKGETWTLLGGMFLEVGGTSTGKTYFQLGSDILLRTVYGPYGRLDNDLHINRRFFREDYLFLFTYLLPWSTIPLLKRVKLLPKVLDVKSLYC